MRSRRTMASSSAMTTRAGLVPSAPVVRRRASVAVAVTACPRPRRPGARPGGARGRPPSCTSASRARTMASAWRAASLCSWVASGVSETRARTRASSADSWTTANCSSSTASSSRARTSRAWTSLIRRSSRTRCMERQVYVAGNQRRRASSLSRTASSGRFPTPGPAGHPDPPARRPAGSHRGRRRGSRPGRRGR